MAKRKFTHRGKQPRRIRLAGGVSTTALAAKDVVVGPITATATDPYRLLSVKLSYTWEDIPAVADDGLEFGLAHSDYTAAEIEECLESQNSIDLGDKVAQEQANRLVRTVGRITGVQIAQVDGGAAPFNDGRPLKTKLNWKMSSGDTFALWIRNGSGTVWTVGGSVQAIGDFWVVDSQ